MVIRTPLTRINLCTIINLWNANDPMVFQPKDQMETMRANALIAISSRSATRMQSDYLAYTQAYATLQVER